MKKLKDISLGSLEAQLDIRNPQGDNMPKVSHTQAPFIRDIDQDIPEEIILRKNKEIHIPKKIGKNFDALESRVDSISFFFGPKKLSSHITIHRDTKREIPPYFLYLRRYIKSLGTIGIGLSLLGVLIAIFVLGYIDKVIVENRVNAGYKKLLDIREGELSFYEIQKKVNNARFDLLIADTLFTPFSIFGGQKINSVEQVIAGGKNLSKSLDMILGLYVNTKRFIDEKKISNIYFSQLLLNIKPELQLIEKTLEKSLRNYNAISWLPNSDLEEKRAGNIVKIENILSYIKVINKNFPSFLSLLGHEERKRYLIVFQNSDEIRPTGGFMGSMGLLEVFRGKIQLFQKKDVYAIEWDLKKSEYERLPAPKGISNLTDTFGLRDANYYVNLKDSSEAIKFFTDRAGIDLDGIVYINQNILLHLLDITGPVYFPELERDITAKNFSEIMSLVVEAKTSKEGTLGTPKQVLFDFMEIFGKTITQKGEYFDYLQSIIHDVESRDIMVYSFEPDENNFLVALGLGGDIDYNATVDFSYPVYTSLSGNKSDRYMKRKYRQSVISAANCSFEVRLEIQSTHDMGKSKRDRIQSLIKEYELDTPNLFQIQGADTNRQFVRLILPANANVKQQVGIAIIDYGKRKGVEFFQDTLLNQTTFRTIEYTLDNPDCQTYNYTFYKQAGIPDYDMMVDIDKETYSYPNRKEDFYFEKR